MQKSDILREAIAEILGRRPDLTISGLSQAAGLDSSTLRKYLSGTLVSLTIETAEKVALAAGMPLSRLLVLNKADEAALLDLIEMLSRAGPETRRDIDGFLKVGMASEERPQAGSNSS